MFYRVHTLAYHKLQFTDLCNPKIITSNTFLRNVVENQLGKAGTPHPENPNWALLLRKEQEVQLPWPRKQGRSQQGPLAIGLK